MLNLEMNEVQLRSTNREKAVKKEVKEQCHEANQQNDIKQ
ncbi:hypothetical protein J2T56_002746 [Natronobacillus azotifigens]